MKFKEFKKWCNNRAADGYWSFNIAMVCIRIVEEVLQQAFYKREKFWKEKYEKDVVEQIVEPLDEKRHECLGGTHDGYHTFD